MTDLFSEDDVVSTVTRLTRSQLFAFVESNYVRPKLYTSGYMFRSVDIAKLEFLCDLSLELDLDEVALGIVVSLIDQLHAARQDLATVTSAINALPDDLRTHIAASVRKP